MAKKLAMAWLLAALLTLAACSGGPDRAEYIRRAEQVCLKFSDLAAQIPRPSDVNDAAAQAEYLRRSAEVNQQQVDELRALERPADDQSTLTEIYDEVDRVIARELEAANLLDQGDERWRSKLLEMTTAARNSNARIDEYGMKRCGSEQA
ncbi:MULTISPECIES: hypothetical protein [Catenuloplanes]|uniref:Lipoprotein n=1 Tax=Catenuloplanes niger TaxID=587534 RepID=A0AAE4CVA5_9ACTN|nr:hypothetical protein [Catenuloplanes niger]MDR7322619.1 hypothetical protein [Catenuloplanes niger]